MLSEDDVTVMLINPIYAVSIDRDLVGSHEPIVSKERWIEANEQLIDEIGTEQWLRRLLSVLEGNYPTRPDTPTIADGYSRDD
jgi:hypothetical protein